MLYCLPEFLPDEFLSSTLTAWTQRLPFSENTVLKLAFGKSPIALTHDFPYSLAFFINQLPPFYSMTLERLINEHTLFPYYASTLSLDRRQRLWDSMCGSSGKGLRVIAGADSSAVRSPNWLRYCPACIVEDQKQYGRAYWHRLHQIPGVFICLEHRLFLENSSVPLKARLGMRNSRFFSPKHTSVSSSSSKVVESRPDHLRLIRLTEGAMYLLHNSDTNFTRSEMRDKYNYVFDKRGALWLERKKNLDDFIRSFTEYYTLSFLDQIIYANSTTEYNVWIKRTLARALNGHGGSMHPLYHLLLIEYFGFSVADFLDMSVGREPFGKGPWTCRNLFCQYYQNPVISNYSIAYRIGRFTGTFTCTCGFTYTLTIPRDAPLEEEPAFMVRDYGSIWEANFIRIWNDAIHYHTENMC